MKIVTVDTSVIAKWYCTENEADLDKSYQLQEFIVDEKYFLICPRIITLELVNVLRFSKKMSHGDCLNSVNSLIDLCTNLTETPKMELVTEIMYKSNLTSYDSAFIALAESKNCPLITADYKHHKKSVSKNIVWLKEWKGSF